MVLTAVIALGWINCWVLLLKSDFEPNYKREIVYGACIASGIGGAVGTLTYMGVIPEIKDTKPANE